MNEWMAQIVRACWRASPGRCCWILGTVLVTAAGQPMSGLLLRDFTNSAIAGRGEQAVLEAAITAAVWSLATQMQGARNLLLNDIRVLAGLRIDEEVLRLVSNAPQIGHLEDPRSLDRIGTVNGQVVVDALGSGIETAGTALGVGLTLAVLSTVSPFMLVALPLALPTLLLNRIGQRRVRRASNRATELRRTADQLLETVLDPVTATELRVTGAGPLLLAEYQARWNEASRIKCRAHTEATALLVVGHLVFVCGIGAALAHLAAQMGRGQAGVGDLVLLLSVTSQLQGLVQAVVAALTRTTDGVRAAQSQRWLREQLSGAGRPAGSRTPPRRLGTGLALRGVTFRYPGTARAVLREVSVAFEPGSVVALVGAHGSGKTSLVKLLTAMYEPDTGEILLDGHRLAGYDHRAWRARTACGFQDFVRFQTLAREAVGTGDLPRIADLVEVGRAVEQGGARPVIDRLEQGLESQLGTLFGGVELSGGQWQKLALSRTCMRQDPLLVVLDEPTASLDPHSEYEIFQRHKEMARALAERSGTVTLLISHRFSTVQAADTILVLADGAIVEQGNHAELMEFDGEYARMYRLQRDSYLPRNDDGERVHSR